MHRKYQLSETPYKDLLPRLTNLPPPPAVSGLLAVHLHQHGPLDSSFSLGVSVVSSSPGTLVRTMPKPSQHKGIAKKPDNLSSALESCSGRRINHTKFLFTSICTTRLGEKNKYKYLLWVCKTEQQAFTHRSDDLSSIPALTVVKEPTPESCPLTSIPSWHVGAHHTHTYRVMKKTLK